MLSSRSSSIDSSATTSRFRLFISELTIPLVTSVFCYFFKFLAIFSNSVLVILVAESLSKFKIMSWISANCFSALFCKNLPRMILNLSLSCSVTVRKCFLKIKAYFYLKPQEMSYHLSCMSQYFSNCARFFSISSIFSLGPYRTSRDSMF